jgi:hypothetical protein
MNHIQALMGIGIVIACLLVIVIIISLVNQKDNE